MQSGCVFWVCEAEWGSEKFLPSTLHAFLCAARGMLQLFGSCRHVTLIFAAAACLLLLLLLFVVLVVPAPLCDAL